MTPNDYEKATFGIIFKYPSGNQNIPQRVCAELEPDRFGSLEHRNIYHAIISLVLRGEVPNTINTASELGSKLEKSGGIEYLESLLHFPELMGVNDSEGFGNWVQYIDNAGRLRHLSQVVSKYSRLSEDFDSLFASVSNVDDFLSNVMSEINEGVASTRTSYRHMSEAWEEEKRHAKLEGDGQVVDLIPSGWPNLEKYMIPRPGTLGGIIGESGMGKTSFSFQLGLGVAKQIKDNDEKGTVLINSLETPAKAIIRLLACIWSSTDSMLLARGELGDVQFRKYMEAGEYISSELPIRFDDSSDMSTSEMMWQTIAQHLQEPIRLSISDYAELFADKNNSEEQRISDITKNHRRLARRINSCQILLSQPTPSNLATRILLLSDARYTKSYEQIIDWGISLYNIPQLIAKQKITPAQIPQHLNKDRAYLFILKNRYYTGGQESFEWIPQYSRFADTSLSPGEMFREKKIREDLF